MRGEIEKQNKEKILRKIEKEQLSAVSQETEKIIKKYIDISEENTQILKFWLIGTFLHDKFETFPLLQLYAQKRSGKSRTLKLLSSLCSDGSVNTSPTETLLFRHKKGPLFFDEMENISSKERGAFRETLNAIYKKGNKIVRYKEAKINGTKEYIEEEFFPYYPVGLANISGIGDVLQDRAIQIILVRSNKSVTKLVEDFSTNPDILKLKKKLESLDMDIPQDFFSDWNRFVQKQSLKNQNLKELFERIDKTQIYGRYLEIFFPLFVISYLCDEIDTFLETAKSYIEQKETDEAIDDFDERLKTFIQVEFVEFSEFVGVGGLVERFRNSLESPEEWINAKWLGRALKRLNLIVKKRLVNGKTQVLLKNNSTNSTNTTYSTNSTNSTSSPLDQFSNEEIEKAGWTREKLEGTLK